ncbi:MAG TPA: ABC transporter ATP-binding protein [Chthoniobacterales bacterium]
MSGLLLQVNGAGRRYGDLTVLSGVSFALAAGETCAILGPSGSGKSTLLALCAGLDAASEGDILLEGQNLAELSEDERAALRVDRVGFVFQNFQLLPTLTALENVMVPAELLGTKDARSRAAELLGRVGLGGRLGHYPNQLSGGEQQRVAIARAFINEPALLFADEPTGNLDFETGHRIVEMLFELNREQGTALLLVTHDLELAGRASRVIRLRGGKVEG